MARGGKGRRGKRARLRRAIDAARARGPPLAPRDAPGSLPGRREPHASFRFTTSPIKFETERISFPRSSSLFEGKFLGN